MGNATEFYAERTQQDCLVCHQQASGSGDLTGVGKGYLLSVRPENVRHSSQRLPVTRFIKLIAGYIHIVTAFFWFGTILYVHLILKPAYAAKGLPPSEVKVGIVSMIVMAITGAVLTFYKISSWEFFLTSRFGFLLLIKILLFVIMVFSAVFVVLVIGPKLKNKVKKSLLQKDRLSVTELRDFDGENGRPAYIAFKGKVYDVSKSVLWKNGDHMKRHRAGTDLTGALAQAPHGEDKIMTMPVIGPLLAEEITAREQPPERVFYFMAYMNLAFVFLILLILALWRWY